MPDLEDKLDYNDESLDPIVRAALMPDPTDEDEPSPVDEKAEKSEPEDAPEDTEEEADPESAEALATDAEDSDEPDESEEPKLTRKEKREERKQRFIDAIKKDSEQSNTARERLFERDTYEPIDYSKSGEYDVKELAEDRTQYGESRFSEGAKLERFYAQQEKFWSDVEHEGRLLELDPKYSFLNEKDPNTFDEDRAGTINDLYLELVGYEEKPQFDKATGRPLIDPNTGQQIVHKTVRRTDLSYEKFVQKYVADQERYAQEVQANSAKNIAAQKSKASIRPGGSSHKSGLGQLKPGDISRMSQAEFEKYEAEIDRQILSALK